MVTRTRHQAVLQIYMVRDALEAMTREHVYWLERGVECGGCLTGKYLPQGALVLYSPPTGPSAHQSRGGVSTDSDFQGEFFETARGFYPRCGLQNLGERHLHPMLLAHLSSIDHATIRDILYDPESKGLPFLLVQLMYVVGKDSLGLKTFAAQKDGGGGGVHIREVPLEVISPDHYLVRTVLKDQPYKPMAEILAAMTRPERPIQAPARPGPPEVLSRMLQGSDERIRIEEEELALLGWQAQKPQMQDRPCVLNGTLGRFECSLIYPPEFPLNPPVFLFREAKEGAFREYVHPFSWNSLSRTFDILEKFLEEHPHEPEPDHAGGGDHRQPAARDTSGNHPEETRRTIAIV